MQRYRMQVMGPHRYGVWTHNAEYVGSIIRTPRFRRGAGRQWTFTGAQADYPTREIAAHHLAARRREVA